MRIWRSIAIVAAVGFAVMDASAQDCKATGERYDENWNLGRNISVFDMSQEFAVPLKASTCAISVFMSCSVCDVTLTVQDGPENGAGTLAQVTQAVIPSTEPIWHHFDIPDVDLTGE